MLPARIRSSLVACCLVLLAAPVLADWQSIAPGFEYATFQAPGPNNVFVVRMDRSNEACTIDSTIGQGRLSGGREVVSSMAARHEGALSWWGQQWGPRYDVVAAINGDFFSYDLPVSGQIKSGWYARRFDDFTGGSGFAWQVDRDAFIGGCVRHHANKNKLIIPATSHDQNIDGINQPRGSDELILYTPQYDVTTGTLDAGLEVIVAMDRPTLILPEPAYARGTVAEIRNNGGNSVIPFDHVVLSAAGTAIGPLLGSVGVGTEVRISQEITHYEHDCETPRPWDWTKTYASIGGSFHFLADGAVQWSDDPGATQRHPRTAIAFNDDYIFFVVVDGRSAVSVGMSMTELGNFCLNELGAVEGINQDGGGSSTLWVNGQVVNEPSDGQERAVANGLLMCNVLPAAYSTRYDVGDAVRLTAASGLYVGPGHNYGTRVDLSSGTMAEIGAHELTGIRATGTNWWRCAIGATRGWLPESALLESDCAGDYTADGQVTWDDVLNLLFCLRGPAETYMAGNGCLAGDGDTDNDIDLHDIGTVQRCLTP